MRRNPKFGDGEAKLSCGGEARERYSSRSWIGDQGRSGSDCSPRTGQPNHKIFLLGCLVFLWFGVYGRNPVMSIKHRLL